MRSIESSLPIPVKANLYKHQREAALFAFGRFGLLPSSFCSQGVALLMEMGCGKTITSVAIAGTLYQEGRIKRVLVVCPLSIVGVWESEFDAFADYPYTLTILKGTSAKKREQLKQLSGDGLQVVVVNYESAWRLEKELLAYDADLIIADEGHKLKEARTAQSKGVHRLGDRARYKLLLTGTLITNREQDVFSQYRFLFTLVQEYRKWGKIKSTYIDGYLKYRNPVTGRIHPDLFALSTDTGRMRNWRTPSSCRRRKTIGWRYTKKACIPVLTW